MTPSQDELFGVQLTDAMPKLRRGALALTRNATAASDLVQETLLKAWTARDRFEPGTQLVAWLNCIMRNSFLTEVRRTAKEQPSGLDDYDGRTVGPAQEWAVAASGVRTALAELPADQAEAIVCIGLLGEKYEEAAVRFGSVVGTIKSRVCRGRQALRQRCQADELFA